MAKIKGICRNVDGCDLAAEKIVQEREKTEFFCEECGKPLYPIDDNKKKKKGGDYPLLVYGAVALLVIAAIVACIMLFSKSKGEEHPTQPIAVVVNIVGNISTVDYDGSEHKVTGYVATCNNVQYNVTSDFTFSGTAEAKSTQVGTTTMGLDNNMFTNTNSNFNVKFNVTDGYLEIKQTPDTPPTNTAIDSNFVSLGYAKYYGDVNAEGKPHATHARMVYVKKHLISKHDTQNRTASVGDYIIGEWVNGELAHGRWYDKSGNLKGSVVVGVK